MSLDLYIVERDGPTREKLVADCENTGWTAEAFSEIDDLIGLEKRDNAPLLIFSMDGHFTEGEADTNIAHLKNWLRDNPETQLILLPSGNYPSADRLSLELGARHTLHRPYRDEDLIKILATIAEGLGKRRRKESISKRWEKKLGFEEIIGTSNGIRKAIELAEKAGRSDCTSIMITGECGTGKGTMAKAIHQSSPRSKGPFIEVNCAAIPRNLLESEFFGYEKGAFTDAKEKKIGLFECANGGTIFLDEVGEIDYSLQAKLLKFLDSRMIRRVSGTQFLPVDVRVISATNKDLKAAIAQKQFRSDLFYRLNVVEICIPPLRERVEDIRIIAESYTHKFSTRLNKGSVVLGEEAIGSLERYSWPGNVRELINVIERAVLLNKGREILPEDLPLLKEERETKINIRKENGTIRVDLPPEGASLEEIEKCIVGGAINQARGNITRAAGILGIGRGTLRYKMKKYGIDSVEIKKKFKNGRNEPVCTTT